MKTPTWVKEIAYNLLDEKFLVRKGWLWEKYVSQIMDELESKISHYKLKELECEKALIKLEREVKELKLSSQGGNHANLVKNKIKKYLSENFEKVYIVYKKRTIPHFDKKVSLLASDFIHVTDYFKLRCRGWKLKDIWTYKIKYTPDNYLHQGALDYWQLPIETFTLKAGDCDDSTAMRVSIAKSLNLEKDEIFFMAVGFYKKGNKKYGHAFPVMITKNLNWYILEATTNKYEIRPYPNDEYEIAYLWDEKDMYKITGSSSFGGNVLKWFDLKEKRK